jgi:hypothetical protein
VGRKRMICFIVFSIVSWASLGNSDGKTSKLEPLTLKHQQAQDGQQVWPFFYICSLLLLTDAEWGWGKSWFQDHCFYSIHYYVIQYPWHAHTRTKNKDKPQFVCTISFHAWYIFLHWKKKWLMRDMYCAWM